MCICPHLPARPPARPPARLQPENVLLDREGHIRVTDFGLSKHAEKDTGAGLKSFVGSPEYLAPEVLLAFYDQSLGGYGKAADWWALGTLLYEMLTGRPPFHHENHQTMYRAILHEQAPAELLGAEPHGAGCSAEAIDILGALLQKEPPRRLGTHDQAGPAAARGWCGAEAVRGHAFFRSVDWARLLARAVPPPFAPDVRGDADLRNFDPEFTEADEDVRVGSEARGSGGGGGGGGSGGGGRPVSRASRRDVSEFGRFQDFSFVRPPSVFSPSEFALAKAAASGQTTEPEPAQAAPRQR
jgi:serine/threonine protein kinase